MNLESQVNAAKKDRLLEFYRDKKFVDCTFKIEGNVIKAHKLILTFSSPVFEKMFFGDLPEDEIEICDITLEDFERVLKYIYIDVVELSSVQDAWNIYYAANKYLLEDLINECLLYIKQNISMSTLLLSYEFADLYNVEDIRNKCFTDICNYFNGAISSGYHMKPSTLSAVLEKNIHFYNTFDLVLSLISWAGQECEIRNSDVNPCLIVNILEEVNATKYMKTNWLLGTCDLCDSTVLLCQCFDVIVRETVMRLDNVLSWEEISLAKNSIPPICKFRDEYKMSIHADLSSDEAFVLSISVSCRMIIFGILVGTQMTPAAISNKSFYLGSIKGSICEHNSNVTIVRPAKFEGVIDYDSEKYLYFRDFPVLEPHICYDIRISYKNCDYSGITGVHCYYMSKKIQNSNNNFVFFFDEPFGSLVKGLSFYAA